MARMEGWNDLLTPKMEEQEVKGFFVKGEA